MELAEMREGLFRLFEIDSVESLGDALLRACTENQTEKFEGYLRLVPDLQSDWLQRIWQYHLADRKEKKQDFTPRSLARLAAELAGVDNDVIDLCAGTGALTIQAWVQSPDRHFTCYELDGNLIPFLLFNLVIRNMDARVYHGDCLSMKFEKIYRITKGDRFGTVAIEECEGECECDKQSALQHKMETERLPLF